MKHLILPQYNTMTFTDLFEDAEQFVQETNESGIPTTIKDESLNTLYYLLFAKYGNSPIANFDINQCKYKIFSIIFMYGPSWEKELEIQKNLRDLTEEEIRQGSKMIYNHAFNPSTAPSTASLTELEKIDEQNTNNSKRSKMEAYAQLLSLLKTDVTSMFIDRFKIVFKQFVMPERPLLFVSEGEDEDE